MERHRCKIIIVLVVILIGSRSLDSDFTSMLRVSLTCFWPHLYVYVANAAFEITHEEEMPGLQKRYVLDFAVEHCPK